MATDADTVSKGTNATATGIATVATKAFSAALKAIPLIAILGAIMGLIEGLAWLNEKFNIVGKVVGGVKKGFQAVTDALGFTSEAERKQAAEAEATAQKNKKLKESFDELAKSVNSEMQSNGELILKLSKLEKQILNTNLSNKERVAAMRKVNEETGKEVFNLKDEKMPFKMPLELFLTILKIWKRKYTSRLLWLMLLTIMLT